jgi:tRNA(Arg) A34 adenosine deaminase TadA
MLIAIAAAKRGIMAGQTPFGAVIVRDGSVLAEAHNTVWADGDPTAHAEMNAIRQAAAATGSIDLSGCTAYTTCEPCPMCLAALHWAKLERVVYGATIADAAAAGFSELTIPAAELASRGGSSLRVEQGPLVQDCRNLFELWRSEPQNRAY